MAETMKAALKKILKCIPGYTFFRKRWFGGRKRADKKRAGIFLYNNFLLPGLLRRAREKRVLKVVFTAWNVPMWKYHSVYRLMEKHPRFEPVVVLTPSPDKDDATRERDLAEMQKVFSSRGYRVWENVCWEEPTSFDFGNALRPDIVFFTQPYAPGKLLRSLSDKIFCYCPYGFTNVAAEKWQHNNFMQNIAWKIFHARKETVDSAKICTLNKARNCVVSGYAFGDELSAEAENDPWKPHAGTPKRVIWAPHFSISDNALFHVSNFLRLHEVMLELAEEFRGKIQWAFKPHPFLLPTLRKPKYWGAERAEAYFSRWKNLDCGQVELGAYVDLFASADAIVHDCGSFTIEWLYTKKPGMYLMIPGSERKADALGHAALDCYYHGSEKAEIRRFLEEVVLGGNDPMKAARERFYEKYLLPPNGQSVAQNILDEIERGLGWK